MRWFSRLCNFGMAVTFGLAIQSGNYAFASAMALFIICEETDDIFFQLKSMRKAGLQNEVSPFAGEGEEE